MDGVVFLLRRNKNTPRATRAARMTRASRPVALALVPRCRAGFRHHNRRREGRLALRSLSVDRCDLERVVRVVVEPRDRRRGRGSIHGDWCLRRRAPVRRDLVLGGRCGALLGRWLPGHLHLLVPGGHRRRSSALPGQWTESWGLQVSSSAARRASSSAARTAPPPASRAARRQVRRTPRRRRLRTNDGAPASRFPPLVAPRRNVPAATIGGEHHAGWRRLVSKMTAPRNVGRFPQR